MLSFIIPTCIRNNIHLNQLKRCIISVTSFHSDSNIYLINDSDDNFYSELKKLESDNIKIVNSLSMGSADQQIFNLILNIDDNATHYIIIQDSMFLNKKLDNVEKIENVKFLWHFTNHINDWDNIKEPNTTFNKDNNINNHTDLIKYHLINYYNTDLEFLNYALSSLICKKNWVGCFGNCCIITKNCVNYLNNNSNFAHKFIHNTTNRERRMNESIFSLLCHYYIPQNYNDSYDGLYYDGYRVNQFKGIPTGFDNLYYCCKNNYLSKISFER